MTSARDELRMTGRTLEEIVVLGDGKLGREVAAAASFCGLKVHVFFPDADSFCCQTDCLNADLKAKVQRWTLTGSEAKAVQSRIAFLRDLSSIPAKAWLIVDATNGDVAAKRALLRKIEPVCGPERVISVNPGGSTVESQCQGLASPGQVVGIRFFPPVWDSPGMEIIPSSASCPAAISAAREFAGKLGKNPVLTPDIPGAYSVRLFVALLNSALKTVEEGGKLCSTDNSLRSALGLPVGPFALADSIGLDVVAKWCGDLAVATGHPELAAHGMLAERVARNETGVECGKGFFDYAADGRACCPGKSGK